MHNDINIILDGRIKKLPQKWNNQTVHSSVCACANLHNGGIVHFIGKVKPWNYPITMGESDKLYHKYWRTSGLTRYKFYYGLFGIKNAYVNICRYKLNRFVKLKTGLSKLYHNTAV